MNIKLNITCLALIAMIATGCGGNDKQEVKTIIAKKTEEKAPTAPIRMQEYNQQISPEWNGKKVNVDIKRTADESLPMVKDENGQEFIDNTITLSVTTAEGKDIFKKTFTKTAFNQYIGEDYRKGGILEGIVFDKPSGKELRFAASVCLPQSDEYMPLLIYISPRGTMRIEHDTQIDSGDDDEEMM